MNTSQIRQRLQPRISLRTGALICVLTAAIAASEALLSLGYVRYTLAAYTVLLFLLSLSYTLIEKRIPLLQAFALIPTFRLVNLTMPVFARPTLLWLPTVYGPFLLLIVYLGWRSSRADSTGSQTDEASNPPTVGIEHELPWWLGGSRGGRLRYVVKRAWRVLTVPEDAPLTRTALYRLAQGFFVLFLPVFAVSIVVSLTLGAIYLAEYEHGLTTPQPLVSSLAVPDLAVLVVTMVGVVGFVEELLFRGVLQKTLESHLGVIPGLLLASGIFGLLMFGYGPREQMAFAAGVGLFFGIVYDVTDSLVLVSVLHGVMNVFLFGIFPLNSGWSTETIWNILVSEAGQVLPVWVFDLVAHVEGWAVLGPLIH